MEGRVGFGGFEVGGEQGEGGSLRDTGCGVVVYRGTGCRHGI